MRRRRRGRGTECAQPTEEDTEMPGLSATTVGNRRLSAQQDFPSAPVREIQQAGRQGEGTTSRGCRPCRLFNSDVLVASEGGAELNVHTFGWRPVVGHGRAEQAPTGGDR